MVFGLFKKKKPQQPPANKPQATPTQPGATGSPSTRTGHQATPSPGQATSHHQQPQGPYIPEEDVNLKLNI